MKKVIPNGITLPEKPTLRSGSAPAELYPTNEQKHFEFNRRKFPARYALTYIPHFLGTISKEA